MGRYLPPKEETIMRALVVSDFNARWPFLNIAVSSVCEGYEIGISVSFRGEPGPNSNSRIAMRIEWADWAPTMIETVGSFFQRWARDWWNKDPRSDERAENHYRNLKHWADSPAKREWLGC